jgi:hypothetical protein
MRRRLLNVVLNNHMRNRTSEGWYPLKVTNAETYRIIYARTKTNVMRFLDYLILLIYFGVFSACATTTPNRIPVGETFPGVLGRDLMGIERQIPDEFAGDPVLLFVGFKQNTQFDIDRWLIGMLQSGVPIKVVELPTIKGVVPGLFAGRIDNGMRSGIPQEDWATVVTLYGDAATKVVALTGNANPNNARVLLLDSGGKIVWFHDSGFSPRVLFELKGIVEEQNRATAAATTSAPTTVLSQTQKSSALYSEPLVRLALLGC